MQIKKICIRVSNNLKHGFQARPCFQLGFHWVSKLIHLTRIWCSGWVRAAWISNEFEKLCSLSSVYPRHCTHYTFCIELSHNPSSLCLVVPELCFPIPALPYNSVQSWMGGNISENRRIGVCLYCMVSYFVFSVCKVTALAFAMVFFFYEATLHIFSHLSRTHAIIETVTLWVRSLVMKTYFQRIPTIIS